MAYRAAAAGHTREIFAARRRHRVLYAIIALCIEDAALFRTASGACQSEIELKPDNGRILYEGTTNGETCKWVLPVTAKRCAVLKIKIEEIRMEFDKICRSWISLPMANGDVTTACSIPNGACFLYYNASALGSDKKTLRSSLATLFQGCTDKNRIPINGTLPKQIIVKVQTAIKDDPYFDVVLNLRYTFSHCASQERRYTVDVTGDDSQAVHDSVKSSCVGSEVAVVILSLTTTIFLVVLTYLYLRLRSITRRDTNNVYAVANNVPVKDKDDVQKTRDELHNELYHMEDLHRVENAYQGEVRQHKY